MFSFSDLLPMSPFEGPPLPFFLGVRWPWLQSTTNTPRLALLAPREFVKELTAIASNDEVEEVERDERGFITRRRIIRNVKRA